MEVLLKHSDQVTLEDRGGLSLDIPFNVIYMSQ